MDDVTYTGDITYAGYVTYTGDATYAGDIIHLLDSAEPDIRFVVQIEAYVGRIMPNH